MHKPLFTICESEHCMIWYIRITYASLLPIQSIIIWENSQIFTFDRLDFDEPFHRRKSSCVCLKIVCFSVIVSRFDTKRSNSFHFNKDESSGNSSSEYFDILFNYLLRTWESSYFNNSLCLEHMQLLPVAIVISRPITCHDDIVSSVPINSLIAHDSTCNNAQINIFTTNVSIILSNWS